MSKVRFCRNVVAWGGAFIFLGSIFSILEKPAHWSDGLELLGVAYMCFTIVRQVDRREGDWHKEIVLKEQQVPQRE